MPIKLICVAGARPNFMKVAPFCREIAGDPAFDLRLVHTGQHYDDRMSGQFFRDLGIREPDYNLEVGSGSHAQQTAEIMKRFEPVVLEEKPAAVVVAGDVNSTVACALVASKLLVKVVHIEAGLRSFDRTMPEEINRVVTDAISDVLLVSEESGVRNLRAEGVPDAKIHLVGNLMIDTLRANLERARESGAMERLGIRPPFGLVTLHRPANVDEPDRLREILEALGEIAREVPLYFPVHPRTRARMADCGIATPAGIHLAEPLGYLDFLCLMSNSAVVCSDSGGIQEESTALGIPCLTLRENTERPSTIEEGSNVLAGTRRDTILAAWEDMRRNPRRGRVPKFWDGQAARRCRETLLAMLGAQ